MFKRVPGHGFYHKRKFLIGDTYTFYAGRSRCANFLIKERHEAILKEQQKHPIPIMSDNTSGKHWWLYQGECYCEDGGYSVEEVQALILDYMAKSERRIKKAMSRMQAEEAHPNLRQPIPDEVKMHVWQRDGGRCNKCGSNLKLEFDHIIPVSMGGSNTARNIQLLCEGCNRTKSGSLV
jgi:hypothetical protein